MANFEETEDLELAIDAKASVDLTIANMPTFRDLLVTAWSSGYLLAVGEQLVVDYLRKMGGYTKLDLEHIWLNVSTCHVLTHC